jgi:hypothetical protein
MVDPGASVIYEPCSLYGLCGLCGQEVLDYTDMLVADRDGVSSTDMEVHCLGKHKCTKNKSEDLDDTKG